MSKSEIIDGMPIARLVSSDFNDVCQFNNIHHSRSSYYRLEEFGFRKVPDVKAFMSKILDIMGVLSSVSVSATNVWPRYSRRLSSASVHQVALLSWLFWEWFNHRTSTLKSKPVNA